MRICRFACMFFYCRMDIQSCYLDGNADAVEFCPHYPFQHILAAATYTLEEGVEARRTGSISLFSVEHEPGLELLFNAKSTGVFDIKWNPTKQEVSPLLAQADADGCVSLDQLRWDCIDGRHGARLEAAYTEKVSSSMCLYVDWSPSGDTLSVGLADGSISVVSLQESRLQVLQSWVGHQYEVWSCSFDLARPHLLYSGSDDCAFSCWDVRNSSSSAVFQNTKSHKMGVCSIAPSSLNDNVVLTGSYDEFIRVWDVRLPSKPVTENSLSLGGGVWRIKQHPNVPNVVLAACMHNGFAVVSVGDGGIEVLETYKKHESLAYGADWRRGSPENAPPLVASCSFYDRLLRLWRPECLCN